MGLFDWFRRSNPERRMQADLRRLAPSLFPGGQDEIISAGRRISAFLDGRIPQDAASKLYASTKYLAHTANDKSKARVEGYIQRQGMGLISAEDASAIYDQFIAIGSQPKAKAESRFRSAANETGDNAHVFIDDDRESLTAESAVFCDELVCAASIEVILEDGQYKVFVIQVDVDEDSLIVNLAHPEVQAAIVSAVERRIESGEYDDPSKYIEMVREMRAATGWRPNLRILRAVVDRGGKALLSWTPPQNK